MFGSELVAMRIMIYLIVALSYKLRMLCVQLYGPSNVMCDNKGVVNKTSLPQYTLGKKHNVVNYYVVRDAAAAYILRLGKEDTENNLSGLSTNI